MSHRTALALSIALTLALAAGIVLGRDRLFEAAALADPPSVTTLPLTTGDNAPANTIELSRPIESTSATAPRVIEIPLPAAAQSDVQSPTQFDEGRSLGVSDADDHDGDHRDDHDRDHDDDEGDHDD